MNPWHTNRHEKIVAYLCRHFDLPEHVEAEVNASHEHGCEEYGEWNHHQPEFNHAQEIAEELTDALGLAAFAIEASESGCGASSDESDAFWAMVAYISGARMAAGRMQVAREARILRDSKASDAREAS